MANVTASEITEIRRIPLNHAQGKLIQILELEINGHTWANGDDVTSAVIDGCDSILAVLSVTYSASGTALVSSSGDEWDFIPAKRANAAGGSNAPTATVDTIDFPSGLTDTANYVYLTLLVETDQ